MSYRLYTKEVEHGLTDFNDDHYHILASKAIDGRTIAIVYDEHQYIVTYGLNYDVLDSIHWEQGHYYDELLGAVAKYESYDEQQQSQIVVIKNKEDGDEIFFVLEVTNYDYDFEDSIKEARGKYYESETGNLLEDYILEAIENAGYDYEFTGFEMVEA